MLELPEAISIAKQLNELAGKRIKRIHPPTKAHKFCWYSGEPAEYDAKTRGAAFKAAEGFGMFVDMAFDNGAHLCISDGINVRLTEYAKAPASYQLLAEFDDGAALVFTVSMYGSIFLYRGDFDNVYYQKSRAAISPFSDPFGPYYRRLIAQCKPTLSVKAFLATEQRFPGIGNGVLQDILFEAGLHPKRKIGTLGTAERERLLDRIPAVLRAMTELGGRDTEKDLYGNPGGYRTQMSRNALASGCPRCGGKIVREAYLGGAVYYCPLCQPLNAEP